MNKIAIQGHPTRGKEVIQIFESLGGMNRLDHKGHYTNYFYYVSGDDNTIAWTCVRPQHMNVFTLEEFEKEFPFKIGDKVKHISSIGIIKEYCYINNEPAYKIESMELGIIATISSKILEPYKEMKEERNITLTINKAKEWYNKGGELKEIALQAYSEEELTKTELPKTWEEFCKNYPKCSEEAFFNQGSFIYQQNVKNFRHIDIDKNVCPSKKSAEAHLALIQLEQLRDCYRQGDIPDFTKNNHKYCISKINKRIDVVESSYLSHFLSFTKREVAEEFLTNFKPLIKIAEDYI